ncbi:hypothetical protein HMPREF1544_01378 [Mucor circinelloides 1006PhL]|uniref:DDE-1 domain-containing protein n=1 Tax=Mucor circinelloides f. circinelloides (strain 1006PhL) TaxID=1220926 RepID=S2JPK5_MUCC1|nr:hypothetical protein HMPREF1544_01378 [Mucor circinelloides 1006PhL]
MFCRFETSSVTQTKLTWNTKKVVPRLERLAGSAEADTADVQNQQLKEVKEALRGYEPRCIYNMDETGLYYRSAPTRTLSQKPVSGVKGDKTRLSDYFFATMMWFFQDCSCYNWKPYEASLPQEEIGMMKKKNRNVAFVLDNSAPVHDRELAYSNVKLVFLPPNTTSHYNKPLDAGFIVNFKYWYRKLQ